MIFNIFLAWKLQAIATYAAEMLSDDFAKEILPFERKNYFGNATYTFTDDDLKAEGLFVDNNGKDEEKIKTPELIHPQEKKKDKSKDKDKDKEKDKSKDKDKEKDKSKDKKEKDKDKDKTKDKDEKKDKKDKKDKKEKDGDKKKEKKDPNEFVVEEGKNVNIPSFYEGEFAGSNAWQVHGDYTQTGKPLLSNDMHLDNYAPSLWFLADIQYKGNKKYSNIHSF
jgi:acyl-homoserine lactone acylase PvdQ